MKELLTKDNLNELAVGTGVRMYHASEVFEGIIDSIIPAQELVEHNFAIYILSSSNGQKILHGIGGKPILDGKVFFERL